MKVSPETARNIASEKTKKPHKPEMIAAMAAALDVPVEVLLDSSIEVPSLEIVASGVRDPQYPIPEMEVEIPLWPALPADENWFEDSSECLNFVAVPAFLARKHPKDPERIAARIVGTSMEPRLYEGDMVIIEIDPHPRPGRIVLARSGKARTLKVLRKAKHDYELHSINPAHGQAVADEWGIEGFLVAILRDYARDRGFIEWDNGGLGA